MRSWAITKETFEIYYKQNRIIFPGDYPFLKIRKPVLRYWKEDDIIKAGDLFGLVPVSTYMPADIVGMTQNGTKEITEIFGSKKFSFPKPSVLIKYLLNIASIKNKDAVVLDFFAGSGTTGQAVMELNREDGSTYSDGLPANLKYYKTDFVAKDSEEIYDDLLEHIEEMIQLQYGIKIDKRKYVIIMDDDEMDEFERNFEQYDNLQALFINQDVLLSSSQEKLLDNVNTYIIPDCYFDFELREAGELW